MKTKDMQLPISMRDLSDKAWLELLIRSVNDRTIDGVQFPGFPSPDLQTRFVGSSNEETLREAYLFYVLVKEYSAIMNRPLKLDSHFLDFGCGWGRFLRFFWKDINPENLYGCDVNEFIIDVCRTLDVPGNLGTIEPNGKLPYPDNFFDAIMAYSVFTHLPENINLHWMQELARVARPGCIFCLTLESRRFLDSVSAIPDDADFFWHKILLKFKPQVGEYKRTFDAGDFVFIQSNSEPEAQGVYGEAVVPLSFIKENWKPYFDVVDYIDNPNRFFQAVLVAQSK